MRTWRDKYVKDLVGMLMTAFGSVDREREIVGQDQRVDMLFTPGPTPAPDAGGLGVLARIAAGGVSLIEPYTRPPGMDEFGACVRKQRMLHHELILRGGDRKEPLPALWIVSSGRPRTLLRELEMRAMEGWPRGFWTMQPALRGHVVVVPDLPAEPATLPLRLTGRGARLHQAIAELVALPRTAWLREVATSALVAWRRKIYQDPEREDDEMQHFIPEMGEWDEHLREQGREEGLRDGRKEGLEKGLEQGLRTLLVALLRRRFGELPAGARKRIDRAESRELERWGERVLDARTLDDVFGA